MDAIITVPFLDVDFKPVAGEVENPDDGRLLIVRAQPTDYQGRVEKLAAKVHLLPIVINAHLAGLHAALLPWSFCRADRSPSPLPRRRKTVSIRIPIKKVDYPVSVDISVPALTPQCQLRPSGIPSLSVLAEFGLVPKWLISRSSGIPSPSVSFGTEYPISSE